MESVWRQERWFDTFGYLPSEIGDFRFFGPFAGDFEAGLICPSFRM